jgi:hypothetical protein
MVGALASCTPEIRPPQPVGQISCVVDRRVAVVSCEPTGADAASKPEVDRSGSALVLKSLGRDLGLAISATTFSDSGVAFDVQLENLLGQRIGSADGRSPDARGIRLLFVDPVTGREPTAAIARLDRRTSAGAENLTAEGQPFVRISAVLDSATRAAPVRVALTFPPSARTASFGLVVVAPVQYPHGWLRITPESSQVGVGGSARLHAVRLDAHGRTAVAGTLTWATTTPDLASVSSSGEIAGRAEGLAHVTVTCGAPCSARSDSAQLAVGPPGGVTLSVRPTARYPISRFIYGVNFLSDDGATGAGRWPWFGADIPPGVTLNRIGGNRMSAYNWRNNYSHAGLDYRFQNDQLLDPSTIPGEAIRRRVAASSDRNAATLVTVPMLPFVAADADGEPLDTLGATRAARMKAHFAPNLPAPSPGDPPNAVYQSEFVHWLDSAFASARTDSLRPIFFSLDNEPDLWYSTHHAIMSDTLGRFRKETYDGFTRTSIGYARAIKAANPDALVFGPATATYAGVMRLGQHPDSDPVHGKAPFFEVYLDQMRGAERQYGRRLLDVLDLHWYTEISTRAGRVSDDAAPQDDATIEARLQAPRSLWDPTFDEKSWVSDVAGGPVALLPRLRAMIAQHYPQTKIAITEYYYGRSGDISGGLAQADVLGIFGREGVFAATLWPQANTSVWNGVGNDAYAYAFGAFRLFRNYDGAGSAFGETGLLAGTTDKVRSSVYASVLPDGRLVLVVINKTNATLRAAIPMTTGAQPRAARVFTMREGAAIPVRGADLSVAPGAVLRFDMPARSASTLVLEF